MPLLLLFLLPGMPVPVSTPLHLLSETPVTPARELCFITCQPRTPWLGRFFGATYLPMPTSITALITPCTVTYLFSLFEHSQG